jgi:hypothetical protein
MTPIPRLPCIVCLILSLAADGFGADPAEGFLQDLPPGVFLDSSVEVPAEQTRAIGQRLGGRLTRLTNSVVRVQGRRIQVNAITAADDAGAEAVHAAILRIKPHPFCLRKDRVIIEYVGDGVDEALAIKTSYELGLEEKPERVRYRVTAELATIDKADYMACNPLFNQFLAAEAGENPAAVRQIAELSRRLEFGRTLVLHNPKRCGSGTHQSTPEAAGVSEAGDTVTYEFEDLPARHGVPYVTVIMELTIDNTAACETSAAPAPALTAATPFWPADDPEVVALAQRITQDRSTDDEKAAAILEWLSPGGNIRYAGETGSRWGTALVLEQKFGHCWDFSDCFVTLARAAGVPSRQVAGWLYGSSGHVWAEYFSAEHGWRQVDPTGGGELNCGIYHIAYFTTEDGAMPIVYLSMPVIEVIEAQE